MAINFNDLTNFVRDFNEEITHVAEATRLYQAFIRNMMTKYAASIEFETTNEIGIDPIESSYGIFLASMQANILLGADNDASGLIHQADILSDHIEIMSSNLAILSNMVGVYLNSAETNKLDFLKQDLQETRNDFNDLKVSLEDAVRERRPRMR